MIHLLNSITFAPRVRQERSGVLQLLIGLDAQYRSRRQLNRLPANLRRDIGLQAHEITVETERPHWDPPTWWS